MRLDTTQVGPQLFWILALVLVLFVLVPIARILMSGNNSKADLAQNPTEQGAPADAQKDMEIYLDQLAEVDRDLARGVLSETDAQSTKTEVARRLLLADKRVQTGTSAPRASAALTRLLMGATTLTLLASFALYHQMGHPGMPDLPLAARLAAEKAARDARPTQLAAEAATKHETTNVDPAYSDLVEKLRAAVSGRPDDVQGHRLLANHEARVGNFPAAREAQQRVLDLIGETAPAQDFTDLAEIMILAAGGYVSPQAEAALAKAIRLDPENGRSRYYAGLSLAQNGRPEVAYRMWSTLLADSPPDAPWVALIQSQLPNVARAAGIPLNTAPASPDAPGPSAQDVENAQQMSADERKEMIQNMVAGLSDRLATEGGTAIEWARLIRAYGVLGERGRANEIWTESKATFANDPSALKLLLDAAQAAEISN